MDNVESIENVAFFVGIVFIFFLGITLVQLNFYKDNKAYIIMLFMTATNLMLYQVTDNLILFLAIVTVTSICSSVFIVVRNVRCKGKGRG